MLNSINGPLGLFGIYAKIFYPFWSRTYSNACSFIMCVMFLPTDTYCRPTMCQAVSRLARHVVLENFL